MSAAAAARGQKSVLRIRQFTALVTMVFEGVAMGKRYAFLTMACVVVVGCKKTEPAGGGANPFALKANGRRAPGALVRLLREVSANSPVAGGVKFGRIRIPDHLVTRWTATSQPTTHGDSGVDPPVLVNLNGSGDAGLPPRPAYRCAVGACEPQNPAPGADKFKLSPSLMYLAVLAVQVAACGSHESCKAIIARNDSIKAPEYRQGVIRFPWRFFEEYRHKLELKADSNEYAHFVLGVMAHEYGHHLDESARVPAHLSIATLMPHAAKNWAPELWADFTAGCVLGTLEAPTDTLSEALSKTAACGHPPAALRREAVSLGFSECDPEGKNMPAALAAQLED